jgi:hypothetical protein
MASGPAPEQRTTRALGIANPRGQECSMTTLIELDDTTPRIAYTATAGQTQFVIPFAFFFDGINYSDYDVLAYVDDVLATPGVSAGQYAVAGALDSDPGSRLATFVTAMTGGESVVLVRDIPIARTANFPETGGPALFEALNRQMVKIFAILQQLENNIARTLRLADSDTEENLDIPAAAERASKFLGFDADGAPIVGAAVTEVPVSAFMETVLDDANAAAARATLGITDVTAHVGLANWHHCR